MSLRQLLRWSGGIELGIEVPPGGIPWQEGAGEIATYASSDWAERGRCRTCGSSLFWRLTLAGPMQGLRALCAGTLDSLDGLALEHEVSIDAKPAGHSFAGERRRMTGDEVLAMVAGGPE